MLFDTARAQIRQKYTERYAKDEIVVQLSTMPGIYACRALHQGVCKLSLKACIHLMLLAERYFSTKRPISWRNVARVMGFSIKTAFLWRNSKVLCCPHLLSDAVEETHKAGRAAFGLSCDASFELPNLVYFGSGAQKQIILAAPISKSKVMI